MKTLYDLYISEIRDIYYAEKKLAEELPRMANKASSEELKAAFEKHAEETQAQVERLEKIFAMCELSPRGKKCHAMEWLLEEANEMYESAESEELRDIVLILSAQKVEHYEISSYGTLCEFAELLGFNEAADLLEESLEEEESTDEKLNELAAALNGEAEQVSE